MYKRQIYQIAESNRIEKIYSVARIESNQNFFCPNWNALVTGMQWLGWLCVSEPGGHRERCAELYARLEDTASYSSHQHRVTSSGRRAQAGTCASSPHQHRATTRVCNSPERVSRLMTSRGHVVRLWLDRRARERGRRFLVHYRGLSADALADRTHIYIG